MAMPGVWTQRVITTTIKDGDDPNIHLPEPTVGWRQELRNVKVKDARAPWWYRFVGVRNVKISYEVKYTKEG